jgi:hypothetical protein
MTKLYKDYPHGCSDKQISKAIEDHANEITAAGGDINTVLRLTPLMVVGHAELQSRQTKRITRVSVGLGMLSIVIACIALWVSIAGNWTNSDSQKQQLELLKAIQHEVQTQNSGSDLQRQQLETLKAIHFELQTQAHQSDTRKK